MTPPLYGVVILELYILAYVVQLSICADASAHGKLRRPHRGGPGCRPSSAERAAWGVGGGENWRETFRSTRFSTFEIALILIFYTRRKVFTMMLFHFLSYYTHLFFFTFSISDIGHKLSVDFLRTLQDSRDFDKRCCKDSAQAAGERHG